jgi:hypothetical protein
MSTSSRLPPKTKLNPNDLTTPIVKGRGPRRGAQQRPPRLDDNHSSQQPPETRQQAAVSLLRRSRSRGATAPPRTMVQATVAVQRDGRSHKPNVQLRAHWGCHDLTALKPPEVLLQSQTAADGPAIEPKRNYPRMNLPHQYYRGACPRCGA